jgi:hypothetical protein
MNGVHKLIPQSKPMPLQNLNPPKPIEVLESKVIYTSLPPFSTRVRETKLEDTLLEKQGIQDQLHEEPTKNFRMDIPALVVGRKVRYDGPTKENALVRITIDSFFEDYPQSHKISLFDPTEDVFFHWTFHCSPFTFKTLAKQMKWDLDTKTLQNQFKEFGDVIKKCVNDIISLPDRFRATFAIYGSIGTLTFTEIVNHYRKIDLISIDFVPSSFSDIKRDVTEFTAGILNEHEKSKTELVRVLEKVATLQPSLLLHSNGLFDSLETYQPDEWGRAQERLHYPIPKDTKEHVSRTKEFLKETENEETQKELVLVKTMCVKMVETGKEMEKELQFAFFYMVFNFNRREKTVLQRTKFELRIHTTSSSCINQSTSLQIGFTK